MYFIHSVDLIHSVFIVGGNILSTESLLWEVIFL